MLYAIDSSTIARILGIGTAESGRDERCGEGSAESPPAGNATG